MSDTKSWREVSRNSGFWAAMVAITAFGFVGILTCLAGH